MSDDSSKSGEHSSNISTPKKKKRFHVKPKFNNSWLTRDDWKQWLRPVHNNPYSAFCVCCNTSLVSEISTIKRHADGIKHKNIIKNLASTSGMSQPKVSNFFSSDSKFDDQVKELEISLCGFIAEHNISYQTIDHLSNFLKNKIPDSKLIKKINLGRTKARGIITNVIGETHKEELAAKLKRTKFSVLVDESTDIATVKQMCIMIRFFDDKLVKIQTYFWELVAIQSSTAESLFEAIIQTFTARNIPYQNIIGFGSDGCNVMMGVHNSVSTRFLQQCPGIKIVKCVCHSLHICASEACKILPRSIEDLARDIYSFFKHSSKRQNDFKEFQEFTDTDVHKILYPSQTRWLSVAAVVKRILEQWRALLLFFTEKKIVERLHSVEKIYDTLSDPYAKLYFYFLDFVLPKVTQINELFQSERVIIGDVYNKMETMYKELLYCFMKRSYVDQNDIWDIDPQSEIEFIDLNSLYLGVKVLNELNTEQIKNHPNLKLYFLKKCQEFFSKLCSQLKLRFDFKDSFLKKLSVFKPASVISACILFSLTEYFHEFKRCIDESKLQQTDDEWRLLIKYIFKEDEIDVNSDIDVFWFKIFNFKSEAGDFLFQNVARFVLTILSLPHSNASCERVFTQVNLIKTTRRNSLITNTINGNLLTKQEIIKNSMTCIDFKPNKSMVNKMTKSIIYVKNETNVTTEELDDFRMSDS